MPHVKGRAGEDGGDGGDKGGGGIRGGTINIAPSTIHPTTKSKARGITMATKEDELVEEEWLMCRWCIDYR